MGGGGVGAGGVGRARSPSNLRSQMGRRVAEGRGGEVGTYTLRVEEEPQVAGLHPKEPEAGSGAEYCYLNLNLVFSLYY